MKSIVIFIAAISALFFVFSQADAQEQPLPEDLGAYFEQKFGVGNILLELDVRYQSNQNIVLWGETVVQFGEREGEGNKLIWQAVDILKKEFGYSLVDVEASNPPYSNYYVIMER